MGQRHQRRVGFVAVVMRLDGEQPLQAGDEGADHLGVEVRARVSDDPIDSLLDVRLP